LLVRHWLKPAMTDTTEEEVTMELAMGRAQLWRGDTAAIVTQLTRPPPTLHGWLAGGDIAGILELRPGIEAWARAQGCEFVTLEGRRGWGRVFRPFGYVADGAELRKVL
jgi:hypothetical protein